MFRFIALVLLIAVFCVALPARAAQSYDNCTGFIDSVPATIGKQGVWCLRKDVSTANHSGNAITVNTNNVTIDCNDFKIGGLGAGDTSLTTGIYANSRQNATIRHCNVRGFLIGINLIGGAGHLVEDNRLDNNLAYGINISAPAENSRIRRNAVYDTGGGAGLNYARAINAVADIIDNDVHGVFAVVTPSYVVGIYTAGDVVSGNRIAGLHPNVASGQGYARGIWGASSVRTSIVGNQVYGSYSPYTSGVGIYNALFCANNTSGGFLESDFCSRSIGNLRFPDF